MKKLVAMLTAIGTAAAAVGSQGCFMWFLDEPEMPKCMIEK